MCLERITTNQRDIDQEKISVSASFPAHDARLPLHPMPSARTSQLFSISISSMSWITIRYTKQIQPIYCSINPFVLSLLSASFSSLFWTSPTTFDLYPHSTSSLPNHRSIKNLTTEERHMVLKETLKVKRDGTPAALLPDGPRLVVYSVSDHAPFLLGMTMPERTWCSRAPRAVLPLPNVSSPHHGH